MTVAVGVRHLESARIGVDCRHLRSGNANGNRDGYRAAARADVNYAHGSVCFQGGAVLDNAVDERLGLLARNQHPPVHAEVQPVELPVSGDVRERLAALPTAGELRGRLAYFVGYGVREGGEIPGTVDTEGVADKDFRFKSGVGNTARLEGASKPSVKLANRQRLTCSSLCACSCSERARTNSSMPPSSTDSRLYVVSDTRWSVTLFCG